MNPDAVKFIGAYIGGIVLGTVGTALAVNKLREKHDPSYRAGFHWPTPPLVDQIINDCK